MNDLQTLHKIIEMLEKLSKSDRTRIVRWLSDKYLDSISTPDSDNSPLVSISGGVSLEKYSQAELVLLALQELNAQTGRRLHRSKEINLYIKESFGVKIKNITKVIRDLQKKELIFMSRQAISRESSKRGPKDLQVEINQSGRNVLDRILTVPD